MAWRRGSLGKTLQLHWRTIYETQNSTFRFAFLYTFTEILYTEQNKAFSSKLRICVVSFQYHFSSFVKQASAPTEAGRKRMISKLSLATSIYPTLLNLVTFKLMSNIFFGKLSLFYEVTQVPQIKARRRKLISDLILVITIYRVVFHLMTLKTADPLIWLVLFIFKNSLL